MVFAFLPTAVLMIVSLVTLFMGGLAAAVDPSSMWMWAAVMTAMGITGIILSLKASDMLYKNSMLLCNEDFDKWYYTQRKIAVSSFGGHKAAVLLNLIYGLCAYERLTDAHRVLAETKPIIQASGNAYYRYCYIMQTISVKEKTQDHSYINELFSEAFQNLEFAAIPKSASKESYILKYKYSRLEYEFYRRDIAELKTTSRSLAEQFNAAAKDGLYDIGGLSEELGYEYLAYVYSIAVSDLILGKNKEAEKCLDYIVSSQRSFPLVKRVRDYMTSKDMSVLFAVIP